MAGEAPERARPGAARFSRAVALGAAATVAAWAWFWRKGFPDWRDAAYEAPISLFFFVQSFLLLSDLAARRRGHRRWGAIWAVALLLLWLRVGPGLFPGSGHMLWFVVLSAHASASGLPRAYRAALALAFAQAAAMKFLWMGPWSGVLGLVAGLLLALPGREGAPGPRAGRGPGSGGGTRNRTGDD